MKELFEGLNFTICFMGLIVCTLVPYISLKFLKPVKSGEISKRNIVIYTFVTIWLIGFAWFLLNAISIFGTGETIIQFLKGIKTKGLIN